MVLNSYKNELTLKLVQPIDRFHFLVFGQFPGPLGLFECHPGLIELYSQIIGPPLGPRYGLTGFVTTSDLVVQ